jgi:hypothetical protein
LEQNAFILWSLHSNTTINSRKSADCSFGQTLDFGFPIWRNKRIFFILWVSNARLNAPEASAALKLKSAIPLFMHGLYNTQGTWWANGRIVHALLYGVAALCLLPVTKRILSMLMSTIINKISANTTGSYKYVWAYFPSAHIIASVLLLTDVVFGGMYRWLVVG